MTKTIACLKCGKQKEINSVCINCGYKPKKGLSAFAIIAIVIGSLILITVIGNIFESDKTKTPNEISNIEVYSSIEKSVKNNLKAPKTAEFPGVSERNNHVKKVDRNKFIVTSWVDSQNSFGALIRTKFSCEVLYSNGIFYPEKLVFE